MITKRKFSNHPNVFKIGLFRSYDMHIKHKNMFQRVSSFHHLQSRENLCLLHPPLILRLYTRRRLDETFGKSVAGFQKVKVLKYYLYKCPSFSKRCGIPSALAYEIYLKW